MPKKKPKVAKGYQKQPNNVKIGKNKEKFQRGAKKMVKVDKKWQKILKVPERMTKNLSLHDI